VERQAGYLARTCRYNMGAYGGTGQLARGPPTPREVTPAGGRLRGSRQASLLVYYSRAVRNPPSTFSRLRISPLESHADDFLGRVGVRIAPQSAHHVEPSGEGRAGKLRVALQNQPASTLGRCRRGGERPRRTMRGRLSELTESTCPVGPPPSKPWLPLSPEDQRRTGMPEN